MPTVGTTHEIIINGVGYRIKQPVGQYMRYRATDFAPKISTGELTHADLDGWSVWTTTDWSGGVCLERWAKGKDNKFFYTEGAESRIRDRLTMGGKWNGAALAKQVSAFIEYAGDLYALCTDSVQKYNNATNAWSSSTALSVAPIVGAVLGTYMALALGDSTDMKKFNGTTWSDVTGIKARAFAVWKEALWRATANTIMSTTDLSPATPTWTAAVTIGSADSVINTLIVSEGFLIIIKEDGIFTYDGTTVREVVYLRQQKYADNGKYAAVFNDQVYYGEQARVKRATAFYYAAPQRQDVTPELFGSLTREKWGWGFPVAFAPSPRWLFAAFKNAENADGAILCYDGSAWHVLDRRAAWTPYAIFYSTICSKLFVNYGATNGTFYQSYNTLTGTVAEYDASRTDYVITPWFDAGFPEIDKAFKEVRTSTRYATTTEKLTLYYEIDENGTWVQIGSVTGTGGFNSTTLPISASEAAVVGKKIRFKIAMNTGSASLTAELFDFTLKYLLRPVTVYGYRVTVVLADNQFDMTGATEMDNFSTQLANLNSAEASVTPITIDTPDGYRHKAYITGTRVVAVRKKEAG